MLKATGGGTFSKEKKVSKRVKIEKNHSPFVQIHRRVPDRVPRWPREGVEGAQGRGDVREARERAGGEIVFQRGGQGALGGLFSSERKKKTRARKEKQRGGGTHSVLCHAWSATAARLPLIALSLFDRVSGGGPPAPRFRAGLTSARRSPSGVAPFDRVSLVWLPTSMSTAGLSSDRGGDGEGEGEEAEGAPSSSSSGVARGRELRGRKCCLLAGARGRKRAEEEEEGRGAAAAAAARERRRSRSRPPTPPTADADDGDGAPRIVAPAATPSLLPRPEKPGADEAPAGSVQQAARIPAEQRRGEGARALLFSSLNGEREKDSGTAWRERGQKQCLPKTLTTKAKKEKEERLLLPFSSYPFYCEMSAARAMVVSRAGCVSS